MKNLENYGVLKMDAMEIKSTNGGNFLIRYIAENLIWDGLLWIVTENNYAYGARLAATGSPGGAK